MNVVLPTLFFIFSENCSNASDFRENLDETLFHLYFQQSMNEPTDLPKRHINYDTYMNSSFSRICREPCVFYGCNEYGREICYLRIICDNVCYVTRTIPHKYQVGILGRYIRQVYQVGILGILTLHLIHTSSYANSLYNVGQGGNDC